MLNVSYKIVANRQDAEDIVQDCFIKAFQKIHQVKEEISLGAWLKRIVINASLDSVRKNKKESWLEETNIIDKNIETEEKDNCTEVSIQKIKACMDLLKEKYRIILTLYMIEDYSHKEISEILDMNESTVRNQYRRGKSQLIQLIKAH